MSTNLVRGLALSCVAAALGTAVVGGVRESRKQTAARLEEAGRMHARSLEESSLAPPRYAVYRPRPAGAVGLSAAAVLDAPSGGRGDGAYAHWTGGSSPPSAPIVVLKPPALTFLPVTPGPVVQSPWARRYLDLLNPSAHRTVAPRAHPPLPRVFPSGSNRGMRSGAGGQSGGRAGWVGKPRATAGRPVVVRKQLIPPGSRPPSGGGAGRPSHSSRR